MPLFISFFLFSLAGLELIRAGAPDISGQKNTLFCLFCIRRSSRFTNAHATCAVSLLAAEMNTTVQTRRPTDLRNIPKGEEAKITLTLTLTLKSGQKTHLRRSYCRRGLAMRLSTHAARMGHVSAMKPAQKLGGALQRHLSTRLFDVPLHTRCRAPLVLAQACAVAAPPFAPPPPPPALPRARPSAPPSCAAVSAAGRVSTTAASRRRPMANDERRYRAASLRKLTPPFWYAARIARRSVSLAPSLAIAAALRAVLLRYWNEAGAKRGGKVEVVGTSGTSKRPSYT